MGGWAAVLAALAAPVRVASLTLSGSIGGLFSASTRASLQAFIDGMRRAETDPVAAGAAAALGPAFTAGQPALSHLFQMLGALPSPGVLAVQEIRDLEIDEQRLAALGLPMLFVVGDRDQIFTPDDVRAVADRLPSASFVVIRGAGHSPYYERAEDFDAALLGVLAVAE